MLLLATAFWGVSFPLMKALGQLAHQVSPDAGTWYFTSMMLMPRFVLAAVVIGLVMGRGVREITRNEWYQGACIGGFAAAGMLFQADGLQFTEASTSAFLTQLYAILIPLWVAWRSRRNPGARVWVCTAMVLAGVAILGQFDWRALRLGRGEAETLLASFFFMGQILTLERKQFALNRVLPITFVMFLVEGIVFGGLAWATAPDLAAFTGVASKPAWWVLTGALTVFCTLGAFLLMNKWQPKISSTEAGLLYCGEPIFSSVFSLFLPGWFSVMAAIEYPNEGITTQLLIGGGLISVANILLQLRRSKQPN